MRNLLSEDIHGRHFRNSQLSFGSYQGMENYLEGLNYQITQLLMNNLFQQVSELFIFFSIHSFFRGMWFLVIAINIWERNSWGGKFPWSLTTQILLLKEAVFNLLLSKRKLFLTARSYNNTLFIDNLTH